MITGKRKYHESWYLQLNEKSVLFWLWHVKNASIQQLEVQAGNVSQIAMHWQSFVINENTAAFIENPIQQVIAMHEALQPMSKLLFPLWIMDRYKEALAQYVRGEWVSSISLCGDIVEFIVFEFWRAYYDDLPSDRRKTPSSKTMDNLETLNGVGGDVKIVEDGDYKKLFEVREMRDKHVHYTLRQTLLPHYSEHLKVDNLDALTKLAEFFNEKNMESKYSKYLDYASKEQSETAAASNLSRRGPFEVKSFATREAAYTFIEDNTEEIICLPIQDFRELQADSNDPSPFKVIFRYKNGTR